MSPTLLPGRGRGEPAERASHDRKKESQLKIQKLEARIEELKNDIEGEVTNAEKLSLKSSCQHPQHQVW